MLHGCLAATHRNTSVSLSGYVAHVAILSSLSFRYTLRFGLSSLSLVAFVAHFCLRDLSLFYIVVLSNFSRYVTFSYTSLRS